jgi:hypothetical protein
VPDEADSEGHKAGQEANTRIAAERTTCVSPVNAKLQAAGATSLRAIAEGLNARGIPTARGIGPWSATQILCTWGRAKYKPRESHAHRAG